MPTSEPRSHIRIGRTLAVLALVATSACSVATPRDGWVGLASSGQDGSGVGVPGASTGATGPGGAGTQGVGGSVTGGSLTATGGLAGPTGSSGSTSGQGSAGGGSAPGAAGGGAGSPAGTNGNGGSVTGVTANSITISGSMPFSSSIGAYYQALYQQGLVVWANQVNAQGGIYGRQIKLLKVDNAGTDSGGVAACKQEESNGSFLTMSFSGPDSESNCLDKGGRLAVAGLTDTESPHWTHVRAILSAPVSGGPRMVEFMHSRFFNATGAKIGVVYNGDDVIFAPTFRTYLRAARAAHQNIVAIREVHTGQSSFISDMQAMRQAGAQVVVLLVNIEVVGILRDAKAIGYQPRWVGYEWCADEFAQAAGDLMSGIPCLRTAPPVNAPAYAAYQKVAAKYGTSGSATSGYTAFTYGEAEVLGQLLKAAGKQLNQQTFLAGYSHVSNYDNGLVPPVVGWPAGVEVGAVGDFPVKCCDANRNWIGLGPAQSSF
jgi:ABC-type branched-subunit amino acid transport system substrate-binding protein